MDVIQNCHCAICGAAEAGREYIAGRYGALCFECLGDALAQVAKTRGRRHGPADVRARLDASYRCFLCNRAIAEASIVAAHGSLCFCDECLRAAADICFEGDADHSLEIVSF